jgi:DNA-directed RNA polymerase specialized sigma24 family protein
LTVSNLEDRERIASALLQLDTLHREVLVLRFHEELSLEEIAKVTRAPLSTVKSRLYRGWRLSSRSWSATASRRMSRRRCEEDFRRATEGRLARMRRG